MYIFSYCVTTVNPLRLYTTPLSAIIASFDINHHLYADDTQIHMYLSV